MPNETEQFIQGEGMYYVMKFLGFISSIAQKVSVKVTEFLNGLFVRFGISDTVYASEGWGRLFSVFLTGLFIFFAYMFIGHNVIKFIFIILGVLLLLGLIVPLGW